MSDIKINTKPPQVGQNGMPSQTEIPFNNAKVKDIVKNALELLSGDSVKVSRGGTTGVDGNIDKTKTSGSTGVPVLDNPDDTKAVIENLEKLIAFLQLDNEERQTEMTKSRIDLQKSKLDTEHEGRMKEIDESIKKMKQAEKAALASRIFGWLGAVLAVVTAVVLTVVTGGVAAGFAIAGAALAVSSLVMNETGAMDKLTKALADHLKEQYGMKGSNAQLAAALIINLSMVALSAGCGIAALATGASAVGQATAGVAKTVADTAAKTASATLTAAGKIATLALTIGNTAVGVGSLAAGGVSTYYQKRSEDAQADTTELEKLMTQLQQRLEESEEELKLILQQIQSAIGSIAELITSATDTNEEIARNIGQMA